jgi:hypothetical protein
MVAVKVSGVNEKNPVNAHRRSGHDSQSHLLLIRSDAQLTLAEAKTQATCECCATLSHVDGDTITRNVRKRSERC